MCVCVCVCVCVSVADTDDSDNQGGAVKGQDGAMADKPARDSCTVSAAAAAANKQGNPLAAHGTCVVSLPDEDMLLKHCGYSN